MELEIWGTDKEGRKHLLSGIPTVEKGFQIFVGEETIGNEYVIKKENIHKSISEIKAMHKFGYAIKMNKDIKLFDKIECIIKF